jgi:hypothetical protein
MNARFRERCAALWHARFFSAGDFVLRALFLIAVFLIVHLAGLREYTAFLSGTPAHPGMSWQWVAFLGTLYLLLYFAFILLVPVLLLAAAILFLTRRSGS